MHWFEWITITKIFLFPKFQCLFSGRCRARWRFWRGEAKSHKIGSEKGKIEKIILKIKKLQCHVLASMDLLKFLSKFLDCASCIFCIKHNLTSSLFRNKLKLYEFRGQRIWFYFDIRFKLYITNIIKEFIYLLDQVVVANTVANQLIWFAICILHINYLSLV